MKGERGIILDTAAVIDMTSTKSRSLEQRERYLRIKRENVCFVTPITVSEALRTIIREGFGSRRVQLVTEILDSSGLLIIDESVAYRLAELDGKIVGLEHKEHQNDRWQVACADFYDMDIATRDKGIMQQPFIRTV